MPTIIWAVMRVVDLRFEAENDIQNVGYRIPDIIPIRYPNPIPDPTNNFGFRIFFSTTGVIEL